MPTLYSLALSRQVKGFGKPCVRAVPAVICGHLCPETKEIVRPDAGAVREALPHYWRKAFDRTAGCFWFPDIGNAPARITLYDSRGRFLSAVWAAPYSFNP